MFTIFAIIALLLRQEEKKQIHTPQHNNNIFRDLAYRRQYYLDLTNLILLPIGVNAIE